MKPSNPICHFLLLSSLYLLSPALQAKTASASPQQQGHQATLSAKVDFIAEFDTNGDGQVSASEFFSNRQQRLAAMDIHANAQVTEVGYQSEYADRLDQRLPLERTAQLKQTEVRFAAVDRDNDGRISLAEYQLSGQRAFDFIDQNKDGVISTADPQAKRSGQNTSKTAPQRRPALTMPTTHSVNGMLAMYDLDQNGQVSAAEYQQQRAAVFHRTDRDQDGALSATEYMDEFTDRLDTQIAKTRDSQLKQALVRFKALDKDGNGILSAPEYHQSGQRMFARWDTDNNRLVSLAEPLPTSTPNTTQQAKVLSASKPATSKANTSNAKAKMMTTTALDAVSVQ